MNIGIDYILTLLLIAAIVAVRRLKFRSVLHWVLIIGVIVSSCTIDLSQSSAITPAAKTAIPSSVLRQGTPTEQNPNVIRSFPTTTIPVT